MEQNVRIDNAANNTVNIIEFVKSKADYGLFIVIIPIFNIVMTGLNSSGNDFAKIGDKKLVKENHKHKYAFIFMFGILFIILVLFKFT